MITFKQQLLCKNSTIAKEKLLWRKSVSDTWTKPFKPIQLLWIRKSWNILLKEPLHYWKWLSLKKNYQIQNCLPAQIQRSLFICEHFSASKIFKIAYSHFQDTSNNKNIKKNLKSIDSNCSVKYYTSKKSFQQIKRRG